MVVQEFPLPNCMTESSSRRVTHFLFIPGELPRNASRLSSVTFPVSPPLRLHRRRYPCGTAASRKYAARIASPPGEWGSRDHVFTSPGHAHARGLENSVRGALFSLGRGARPCRKSRAHRKGRNAKRPIHFKWGAMLAASHPRADFGIVDLRTCLRAEPADESAAMPMTRTIEQIVRVSRMAGFTPELLNPAAQSV